MKTTLNIKKSITWIICLACLLMSVLVIYDCSEFRTYESIEDNVLKQNLNEVLKRADEKLNRNERTVFRLDTLTQFRWDKMYVFAGYITSERIEKQIGVEWGFGSLMGMYDQDKLLVFMKGNTIVSTIKYPVWDKTFLFFSIGLSDAYASPEKSLYYIFKQYDSTGHYVLMLTSVDQFVDPETTNWINSMKFVPLE